MGFAVSDQVLVAVGGALTVVSLVLGIWTLIRKTQFWPYSRKSLVINWLRWLRSRALRPLRSAACRKPTTETRTVRVALVQFDGDATRGDARSNRHRLLPLALEAVARGAQVLVFPEGGLHGYGDPERGYWCAGSSREYSMRGRNVPCCSVDQVAELLPGGESERFWTAFARERNVVVLFDLLERDGERFYNSLAVTGPQGFLGRHRKVGLMPEERPFATPGAGATVIDTPFGRYGLMICNDSWLGREMYAECESANVDAIVVSSFWNGYQMGSSDLTGRRHFALVALEQQRDVLVADHARSDATGRYRPGGLLRPARGGLPRSAAGREGVSIHDLKIPARSGLLLPQAWGTRTET